MICIKKARGAERLTGLMFKKVISCGLFILNCNSVHTFFMFSKIDLIFFDETLIVKKVFENAQPWKLFFAKNAIHVLEAPTNFIKQNNIIVEQKLPQEILNFLH